MDYFVSTVIFTGIALIGVLGVYLITGLTGLFSLGQAAFMAIGGYVSAVLIRNYNVPVVPAVALAIVAAMLAALLVGLPTVRLRRDYISLVTLGFGEAIVALLNNSANITGGAMGISGIPQLTTLPVVLVSVVVCLALVILYKNSKYGRQCLALRSDELAAKSMGIDVYRLKLITFLFAGALTGYAGVLFGFYTTYLEPAAFNWIISAEWTIIVFVGGVNSLTGTVLATILLTWLPEFLRFASEWRVAIYCVIVLLIVNYRTAGIMGERELSPKTLRRLFGRTKEVRR
jgi:branched-chain amino acid transport system permease protein